MSANFLGVMNEISPFRFWCQKVLPLVYDDSLSYYELLCRVVDYINKLIEDEQKLVTAYSELEEYVNTYFDNLDVQEEINHKLDEMAADGSLTELIRNYVDPLIEEQNEYNAETRTTLLSRLDDQDTMIETIREQLGAPLVAATAAQMTDHTRIYVYTGSESGYTNGNWYYYDGTAWRSGGIYNSSAVQTDTTLTVSGMAADAKATGDALYDAKGVALNNTTMAASGYTSFVQVPSGVYLVYVENAGDFGFPVQVGQSFVLVVTNANSKTGYPYKMFRAYSPNAQRVYYTICGGSTSPSNPPVWREILTERYYGAALSNSGMTAAGWNTFLDIAPGKYLVVLDAEGDFGFSPKVGRSFELTVSNKTSGNYTFKTFKCFGNNGLAVYSIAGGSSSASNLPTWFTIYTDNGRAEIFGVSLNGNEFAGLGYASFLDVTPGMYLVYIDAAGDWGFPSEVGQTFLFEVSNRKFSSGLAYKTFKVFGNNGYAFYCMAGGSSSATNLPTWHLLTNQTAPEALKFDAPLDTVKLLLLGDSITVGSGASGLSGTETFTTPLGTQTIYTSGNSWAVKLTNYLSTMYPNIEVINHGYNGLTLGQLNTNLASFIPEGTTHCIIGLGVNSEGNTSFDATIVNIVNNLKARGIKVFAWTSWIGSHPNMTNINTAGRVQAALVHAYHAAGIEPLPVYSLAWKYMQDHNLSFNDVMELQAGDENVHPNDTGHEILYRIIREGFGF